LEAAINSITVAKSGVVAKQSPDSMHGTTTLPSGMKLGGFDSEDGDRDITVWVFPVQLQIAPRLKVQIKLWKKDVSKSAPFHSLHIDFHFDRIRYNKHGKTKRRIENFKKTVTEPKRPDVSLTFRGKVGFQFESDARFATLSGGRDSVMSAADRSWFLLSHVHEAGLFGQSAAGHAWMTVQCIWVY
jgi:hypothetical protein